MPESSASESTPTVKATKPKTSGFSAPEAAPQQGMSVPTIAALALSVIAIVLAIFGWFRPATGPGKFSAEQQNEAKTSMCQAAGAALTGMRLQTNLQNPMPDNPAVDLAIAANARLALYSAGDYLAQRLETTPATPADLTTAINDTATTLKDLGINYMAGHAANDEVQQPLRDKLRGEIDVLNGLCQE